MFGDNSSALLALGVLLIAVLSVVALYLWWSSGREDDEDSSDTESSGTSKPAATGYPSLDEPLQGSFIERLRESLKPLIPKRSTTLPASRVSSPPSYAASVQTYDSEAVEVVRVLRDLADGSLMVEVGGVRYRSMEQVVDQTVARRLIGNAQEFAQFVGMDTSGEVLAPPPSYTVSPPPVEPRPTSKRETEAIVRALAPEDEIFTQSVADAIDDLLQDRLAASSEFSGRTIHIRESADGGVVIDVDGTRYESVADISETPVREFIQATIRAWESEQ